MYRIPRKIKHCLEKDNNVNAATCLIMNHAMPILEKEMFFFPEYTDHGVDHVNRVLAICEKLISRETWRFMTPEDMSVLILSVTFHDLSMHIGFEQFQHLISRDYSTSICVEDIDWKKMWDEYMREIRHYNAEQTKEIFGESVFVKEIPTQKASVDYSHLLVIGEFLRRHHHELSKEIVVNGILDTEGNFYQFFNEELSEQYKSANINELISHAVISHCNNLWDVVLEMENKYGRYSIDQLYKVHIIYVMTVLRLADYLDISPKRAPLQLSMLEKWESPASRKQWEINQSVKDIRYDLQNDSEAIYITFAPPKSSEIYLGISLLLKNIQNEFDICWGVLGYLYNNSKEKILLTYRRVLSNFFGQEISEQVNFIPEEVKLRANRNLLNLLIGPLYSYNSSFAIREMIQNAVDACIEKAYLSGPDYSPVITIHLIHNKDAKSRFSIQDNGIGMDKNVIINYFLVAGGSYKYDANWKKLFYRDGTNQIARTGQFGIGVLSSFMLGKYIQVETLCHNTHTKYSFVTTLNNEQIDINKMSIHNEQSGTKISIDISEEKYQEIISGLSSAKYNWRSWYQLSCPRLDIKITDYGRTKKIDSFTISHDEFHEATFDNMAIYWRFGGDNRIFYNRILIPNSHTTNYKGLKNIELSILDSENKLNLSLDRTTVDCKEILEYIEFEICKDYLCCLLSQPDTFFSYEGDNSIFLEIIGEKRTAMEKYRTQFGPVFFNDSGQVHIGFTSKNFLEKHKFLVLYGDPSPEELQPFCDNKYFINICPLDEKGNPKYGIYSNYINYNQLKFKVSTFSETHMKRQYKKYVGDSSHIKIIQQIEYIGNSNPEKGRLPYMSYTYELIKLDFLASLYHKYIAKYCGDIIPWDNKFRTSTEELIREETITELKLHPL